MKKCFLLIILSFLVQGFCFSQFKFSANTGYLYTDINEILWNKFDEDSHIISLLDWETYASPLVSLKTEYKFADTFLFGLRGIYAIPLSYGKMQDFDYMNVISTGNTECTHYSNHDNKLNNYWNAGLYLGAGGKIIENLELTALFSVLYSYYCFTAYNGYKQYGTKSDEINGQTVYTPWTSDIPKVPMQGKIITLETQKLYFGIGSQLDFSPSEKLTFSINFNFMPTFFTRALDTHYHRSPQYSYFELSNEFAFDSSILLGYNLNDNNSLNIGFDCFYSYSDNGKLYQSRNKNIWMERANQSGINETTFRVLIGYTYIYE